MILVVVAAAALFFRNVPEEVSAPLFVLVVIVEVIVAPIPGGAVGYLGAARYGFWQAWPLLYIGNVIGTTVVFLLARRFGAPIFAEAVSARKRRRYDAILSGHPVLLWLVYTIPIVPVDMLSILAGLSHIPPRRFFLIAFSGYAIYTGIVAFVGSFLADYIGVADALSVIGIVFLAGMAGWLWQNHRRAAILPGGPTALRIALTGNIASGKSSVVRAWQRLGATVIDADELARQAVAPGTPGLQAVVAAFGDGVLAADGSLDRAALRNIVFREDAARQRLEAIVHPEVARLRTEEERRLVKKGARRIVNDIPLLFEAELADQFDVVVVVDAPAEVRLDRIVKLRGIAPEEAQRMIDAQMPSEEKRERADYVIDNTGTAEDLRARAEEVWRQILSEPA